LQVAKSGRILHGVKGDATPEAVREQLDIVLRSAAFSRSERQSSLLRYLVERHLEGRDGELKESVIAFEVFGRKPDYDPKVDAIVRTEAVRLRKRLAAYYASEGSRDEIVIELPKGGYRPTIRRHAVSRNRTALRWRPIAGSAATLVLLAAAVAAISVGDLRHSLSLKVGGNSRRYEANAEAYDLYLRGRHAMETFPARGQPTVKTAIRYFDAAIASDPNYAIAFAGKADALLVMDRNIYAPDAYAAAKAAAERAVTLDQDLSEAQGALGSVLARDYQWQAAENAFRRALELNWNNALAHVDFGISVLLPERRFDEALAHVRRAVHLDPLPPYNITELARALLLSGRYEEAIDVGRRAIRADVSRTRPYNLTARALYLAGRTTEALAMFEDGQRQGHPSEATDPTWPPHLACAYVRAGRRDEASELLRAELNAHSSGVPARRVAQVYACLEDTEHTLEYLNKMLAQQEADVPEILVSPELAFMQSDRRVAAMRQRLHLTP
jgi:tetratricopeptide (TPR) repeat protein